MRAFFAGLGIGGYVLLLAAALLVYVPAFFAINWGLTPELSARYIAGSGVIVVAFLITVIALQSVTPFFMLSLVFEIFVVALTWWLVMYVYAYPPDAYNFSLVHLGLTGVLIAWNLMRYRKHLRALMDDD
ncbi:hypothetical protein GYB61_09000 [bacterium]|nr:hypothetical protein [bacterium]